MNFQNLLSKRKILSKAFNSHMVHYTVINNFFVSFEISGGLYNLSRNTLESINEIEKCIVSFMENVVTDFFNLLVLLPNFCFGKGDWTIDYVCTQFRDFAKNFPIFYVVWQLVRYLVHSVCSDNSLVLFHLRWKETTLTYSKSLKVFFEGF